ncbi:hypothetical protein [uncultured Gilvimarinus sp.]|uniref:hypothetical protein n=1 Tax=uncultured Gilvimarinus sp. TaxID=1689143 RepID=UPI0030DAA9C0
MKKIAFSLLVFGVVTSAASMADEKPWKNSFDAEKSGLRYQQGSLEFECSDEAIYAKYLSAGISALIRFQGLKVEDIKADESIISVDPNDGEETVMFYDDSKYLNGSVSGSDIPSDVKSALADNVRRNTTLVALKYRADYEGKSFGDDFPDTTQREVWDFCVSQGEAMLRNHKT